MNTLRIAVVTLIAVTSLVACQRRDETATGSTAGTPSSTGGTAGTTSSSGTTAPGTDTTAPPSAASAASR